MLLRAIGEGKANAPDQILQRWTWKLAKTTRKVQDRRASAEFPEAKFVVRVAVREVFPNCPRYIHKRTLVERSAFVPREGCDTPVPDWKRSPLADGVLPAGDPALPSSS